MERVRQNGGTFGIIAAIVLALLLIVIITSGFDPGRADPAEALSFITQSSGRWTLAGVLGVLGSLFAVVFVVGLYHLLRDKAPTRAYAVLLFGVLGSGGYALASVVQWLGGAQVAAAATADQIAASHAWVALNAVTTGLNGLGNASIGGALLVAGWAITATRALSSGVGWLAYLTGILTVLALFTANVVVFFGSFVLVIIWLAWAGFELRR